MTKIEKYEVVDHGIDHSQYFQGCGVAFTEFDAVVTGIGNNAVEAFEDALEQLAMDDYDVDGIVAELDDSEVVPEDAEDTYYYVSIRVK